MKSKLLACLLAASIPCAITAQSPTTDSLEIELESALNQLDSNLVATLPPSFMRSLLRIITLSLEEAAKQMEAASQELERELNIEVIEVPESGGITIVTGAGDQEVELDGEQVRILVNSDTLYFPEESEETEEFEWWDDEHNELFRHLELGQIGHWSGLSIATGLLTDRPNPKSLNRIALLNAPLDLESNNALSTWNIQLNPWERRLPLLGDFVRLTTGMGLDWWRFQVAPESVLALNEVDQIAISRDTVFQVTRNHLSIGYLRVPILLSLRTESDPEKAMHLEVGFVGGIRLFGQYQRKYHDENSTYTDKVKGLRMNPLQLNSRLTLGYGGISIFAELPLLPLFIEDAAPTIYPISVGIRFGSEG